MPIALRLEGLSNMIDKFKSLPNTVKQDLDDELTASAEEIVTGAKVLCPVDVGTLRNSIQITRNEPLLKQVSATAEYAAYVEFGTGGEVDVPNGLEDYAIQFKGAGKRRINLPARPYFFPAFFRVITEMQKRIQNLIENAATK